MDDWPRCCYCGDPLREDLGEEISHLSCRLAEERLEQEQDDEMGWIVEEYAEPGAREETAKQGIEHRIV